MCVYVCALELVLFGADIVVGALCVYCVYCRKVCFGGPFSPLFFVLVEKELMNILWCSSRKSLLSVMNCTTSSRDGRWP